MSLHDFNEIIAHYPDVILAMPQDFNSHEFIIKFAQQHQRLYVEALYSYRNSLHRNRPAPFLIVHGELSRLLGEFPNLIVPDGRADSHDIFGQPNICAAWRKIR